MDLIHCLVNWVSVDCGFLQTFEIRERYLLVLLRLRSEALPGRIEESMLLGIHSQSLDTSYFHRAVTTNQPRIRNEASGLQLDTFHFLIDTSPIYCWLGDCTMVEWRDKHCDILISRQSTKPIISMRVSYPLLVFHFRCEALTEDRKHW
jgi:hypothetical protein